MSFYLPAEWEAHEATILTYPHNTESWPKAYLAHAREEYHAFIAAVSKGELVHLNLAQQELKDSILEEIDKLDGIAANIVFHFLESDDCWSRDHSPILVKNQVTDEGKMLNFEFNAWGNKYAFEKDNALGKEICAYLNKPFEQKKLVLEGGAIETNGKGLIVTTESCLLNPNRNGVTSKNVVEQQLKIDFGANEVLWLEKGIVGDDTDGHIDDITRFISSDTLISILPKSQKHVDYKVLKNNYERMINYSKTSDKISEVVQIQTPEPTYFNNKILPASYANFYFCNAGLIVPVFACDSDEKVIDQFESLLPNTNVIPLKSNYLIMGLGSFHCLSMQITLA
jgi:agmatine deiminase